MARTAHKQRVVRVSHSHAYTLRAGGQHPCMHSLITHVANRKLYNMAAVAVSAGQLSTSGSGQAGELSFAHS